MDEVKERLVDVPSLMEKATIEVEDFDKILLGVDTLLDDLYRKETEASERLAIWAE
ncbi:MAG: hypothetical protein ACW99G_02310 [Candidatus Thorarchaeota archaeon]